MRLPLALAALLLSGGLACAADVVFPRNGSVGIVPPEGMVESAAFSGFEDTAKGAAILLVEMPPQAFDQVAAGFTDAALATKGIQVESRSSLQLPGDVKSLLITGRQQSGNVSARKWVLLAGAPTATALITVQEVADGSLALSDEDVRKTLATLTFRAPLSPEQQMANLPFKLDNFAGFRPVKVIGNTAVILTDGEKDVIEGAEQPILVLGAAPGTPREDDRRQFALRALSSVPAVKDLRIERAEPLRIGNLPGFEILAQGKDATTNMDVKVVQWLRFGHTAHLRMVGIVKASDFAELYPRLRAVRDGIASN